MRFNDEKSANSGLSAELNVPLLGAALQPRIV
jgi:hypothetical protein